MYVQDAFTLKKSHNKCTAAQKEAHWFPYLVLIFNSTICVEAKNM